MATPVTELEAITLGCVARTGPCTAYRVRQQFQRSPSARFSGSAGAIYPLLKRLEQRGLVRSRDVATGKRPASEYSITPAGRSALRAWLRAPMAPREVAVDDPLRTRMLFLDELPPAARRKWLDAAEEAVRAQEQLIADFAAGSPDAPGIDLANENARRLNRVRLRWLADARERLG